MAVENVINTVSEILTFPYSFSPINIHSAQLYTEIFNLNNPVNNINVPETMNINRDTVQQWERLSSSSLPDSDNELDILESVAYESLTFEKLSTNDMT